MLFEGEITEELMMLIYGFAILITIYVMIALILFFGHRKGKNYEENKRKQKLNKYNDIIDQNKGSEVLNTLEQENSEQNPT